MTALLAASEVKHVSPMVEDHVGLPCVVLLFSLLLPVDCLSRLIPFFGWLDAVACGSGLFW